MFRRSFYTCLGVIVGLFCAFYAGAQTTPVADYTLLPGGNNAPVNGSDVCPDASNTFTLVPESSDVGDIDLNEFEWAVYGATITAFSGSEVIAVTTSEIAPGIHFSSVRTRGVDPSGNSFITVTWDAVDIATTWAAVRQNSEWACTNGAWSVYSQELVNQTPVFTFSPPDIQIAWEQRGYTAAFPTGYSLDLPTINDPDACPAVSTFSYTVDRPVSGDLTGTDADLVLAEALDYGENIVTWTIVNGNKTIFDSYTITVEPELEILNVAWINPFCGNDNGSVLVTNLTNQLDNPFSLPVEYSLFDGTDWTDWDVSNTFSSLAAGSYSIKAGILYNEGTPVEYRQETAEYTFTLTAMAATAVNDVPDEGAGAVVVPASCLNTADGEISVNPAVMIPQNNALTFNGSSDYLLLNKAYNSEIGAFSVAAWIKTTANSGSIVSFDNSNFFHLGLSTGRLQLTTTSPVGGMNIVTVENVLYKVNNNSWHLVAATFDGVDYNLYVDGVLVKTQAANGATIGSNSITRYGMIGSLSTTATFTNNPGGTYFNGQIAEVGVWDGSALAANDVNGMFSFGIGAAGPSDHWVLNNTPANVSAAYSTVFTDAGNLANASNWARYYGTSLAANNAPKLYYWDDDNTIGMLERDGLAVGTYRLYVSDIFGCGTSFEDYDVINGDDENPLILWNVSVGKTATQSSDVLIAALATDGLYSTNAETSSELEPWLDVNLANNYPVRMVRLTTASAMTNVWVMVSLSPFTGATLNDDLTASGVFSSRIDALSAGTTEFVTFNTQVRYVRIRAEGTVALDVSEVEVLTSYKPASWRTLYLSDECNYDITADDATVDPIAYDACAGVTTIVNDYNSTATLVGESWPIQTYATIWTATDDKGLQSTLNMTYEVVDEVLPVFESDPFATVPATMTYCEGLTYQFPIPDVTDNYNHCAPIRSITLYRDGWLAYSVDMGTYDHTAPGLTAAIPTHMQPGNHTYEWEVIDFEGNTISTTHDIYIEAQPLLREVRVAPISCNDANNAIVYFSKIESEAAATVDYILRPINGIDPDITQNTATFSPVAPGNYRALISVNGCPSNIYAEDVVITNPAVIALNPSVTDVLCYGESTGAIALNTSGGSRTNVLHFMTDGSATAGNYAALNISNSVMIECWIFLDSLSADMNWNADLFGVGSNYGLRMLNGALQFYVGTESVTDGSTAIAQRIWHHIAGEYTWNGTDAGLMTLYVDGASVGTTVLAADPAAGSGGNVYFAHNGNDYLNGFVRNARIWSAMPATFGENMRLVRPIVPAGITLLASYPVNETGGATIVNSVSGGSAATISGTRANQRYAYYWLDPDGNFLSFNRDITGQPTGDFNVSVYDPLGCSFNSDVNIGMGDDVAPTMEFWADHDRNTTLLGVGVPVVRYTDDVSGGGNVADDCYYFPYDGEFDPRITDGDCPVDNVTLSFVITNDGAFGVPAPAVDAQSLDGVAMTGIIELLWTATDENNNSSTQTVTYYAVDNEPPVGLTLADATRYTDDGSCTYTVAPGDLIPTLDDNCDVSTGRLYNNFNNSSTLDGFEFDPAGSPYTITWTYEDKEFPDEATNPSVQVSITLTVLDEQMPTAICQGDFTTELDELGEVSLDYLLFDNNSDDNCGTIVDYHLTRNMAYTMRVNPGAATQSSYDAATCGGTDAEIAERAIDGWRDGTFANCFSSLTTTEANPWWQVDLGAALTLYGVNVYNSDAAPLADFWVLVSSDGSFSNTGDWTESGAVFGGDVTYAEYFTGPLAGSQLFSFPTAVTGRFVQIRMNSASAQLALAEVEVYGAVAPASDIVMDCDDVRYTPAPDTNQPGVFDDAQGSFDATGVLMTVIDEDGNTGSCLTDVTVRDMQPATVITVNATLELDPVTGTINLDAYVNDIDDGSTDACGIETMWVTSPEKDCGDIGGQSVTFNVRDIYGNVSSRQANITIADTEAPAVTTYANIYLYLDDDGQYTIDPRMDFIETVSDNCDAADELIYTTNPASVECDDIGYIDLTLEVSDLSGNTRTFNFLAADNIVEVIDNRPPVASLEQFQLVIQSDGDSMIRFQDIIPDANLFDNCDGYGENIPFKQIKYTSADVWCDAGDEGSDGTNAFSNIAGQGDNTVSASEAEYTSHPASNASDNNLTTSFVSGNNTGTRYIEYNFGSTEYEFERIEVRWHEEIFEIPSQLSVTEISSTRGNYSASYTLAEAINGSTGSGNAYVPNQDGATTTVYLKLDDIYSISQVEVNWYYEFNTPDSRSPSSNNISFWNGSSWSNSTSVSNNTGSYNSVDISGVVTDSISITFTSSGGRYAGIGELRVYGSTPNQDCVIPTTAYLMELDTDGSTWIPVSGAEVGDIGLNGTPDNNSTTFTSNIETTALRLYFTGTNGYVGIKEWRVYGRLAGAASACTKYDCSVVHTDVDVWLQWQDSEGNSDGTQVQISVIPYFDIRNVDLKDCGYDGERFYPTIIDLDETQTNTYLWTVIEDNGGQNVMQDERLGAGCQYVTSMERSDQNWAQGITTGCTPYPADGDYAVGLNVSDENGCFDDYTYNFSYVQSNTQATSIDSQTVCLNEIDSLSIYFTEPWEFWRESDNEFFWNLGTIETDGAATVVEGGQTGDYYIKVRFDRSTLDYGTTTNITYQYRARRLTTTVNSTSIQVAPAGGYNASGQYTLEILDSLTTGGPYFTADADWYGGTRPEGTRFVVLAGPDVWFGDYTNCLESRQYRITVLEVTPPVIEAYDAYGTETWVPASSLDVCPRDTIWYRVSNMEAGEYAYLSWSLTNDSDENTGRRLAQGNFYDDSIQVVWDQILLTPELTVLGYNDLDCSSETNFTLSYTDTENPVLKGDLASADNDCSALDTTRVNNSGQCSFTFQSLPRPLMTDDCHDWIESSWCEVDLGNDASVDRTGSSSAGFYPVGISTVTWYARDYSGKQSSCTHTVEVTDNEDPSFNKIPTNVILYADATGVQYFTATTHNLTASDNCAMAVGSPTARIDMSNNGSWDYTGLTAIDDPTSLRPFPFGTSLVEWTATDIYGNSTSETFTVEVRDNTRPTIAALPDLTHATDAGICTYDFPSIDAPTDAALLDDNVSTDAYLATTVAFVSRNDGLPNLLDPYEKGTTVITWRVTDESGNSGTQTQNVIITDEEVPWFDSFNSDPRSISYCTATAAAGYRLPIPTPDDNCDINNVASITYRIQGNGLDVSNTILRANGAFNPYGNGLTAAIPGFAAAINTFAVDPDGTDFTVTWTALDEDGNNSYDDGATYTYNLHVEIEPVFGAPSTVAMTCGGADDAQILINTSDTDIPTYHYDRNYNPEFSINNGNTYFPVDEFTVGGGSYTVKMRVNGCVSANSWSLTIDEPTPYTLSLAKTDVLCPEHTTGTIDLTMGGGAAGQLHFNGSSPWTVADYDQLDVTSDGTVAAWVYLDNLDNGTLFSKGSAFSMAISGNDLVFTVEGNSITASSFTLVPEYWYYVAGTWSAGGMSLYINGALEASGGGAAALANADDLSMGSFDGILRDLSVWNTVIGGDYPADIYSGKEVGLAGFWQLNDGAGASAYNSTQADGFGSNAGGSALLWNNALPQPGFYAWKWNNAYYSDLINLADLAIGEYSVVFEDPFGCPDPALDPLTDTVDIVATDNVAPVIQDLGNLTVSADLGYCYYVVNEVAEATALTPTITDASHCDYEVTWQVVTDYNLAVWTYTEDYIDADGTALNKLMGATLGRSDLNGLNTVTVTTLQNDEVTSTEVYTITVTDDEDPDPVGKFDEGISVDLDEFGNFTYLATDFNLNSGDNCSDIDEMTYELFDGTDWGPSIVFDCSAIGTPVTVQFRVTDQAGNQAVEARELTDLEVRDVTAPLTNETSNQPRGPYCATIEAAGAVPAYTTLSLELFKLENYTDNCGVTRIRYKRDYDHATFTGGDDADWQDITDIVNFDPATMLDFYEGTTTITFELADGDETIPEDDRNKTEQTIFIVTILPQPEPGGIN